RSWNDRRDTARWKTTPRARRRAGRNVARRARRRRPVPAKHPAGVHGRPWVRSEAALGLVRESGTGRIRAAAGGAVLSLGKGTRRNDPGRGVGFVGGESAAVGERVPPSHRRRP